MTLATPNGAVVAMSSATFGSVEAIAYTVENDNGEQWLEVALYHVVNGSVVDSPLALRIDDPRANPSFSVVGTSMGFAVVWTEAAGTLLDDDREIDSYVALIDPTTGAFDLEPTAIGSDQVLASSLVAAPDGGVRFAARLRFDEEGGPTVVAHMVKLDPFGFPFGTHFITNADTLAYLDAAPDGDFLLVPFIKGGENAGALQYFETQTTLPICSFPIATELQYDAAVPEAAALINGRLVVVRPDPPPAECESQFSGPGAGGALAVTSLLFDESLEEATPWLDATDHWMEGATALDAESGVLFASRDTPETSSWTVSAAPFPLDGVSFGASRDLLTLSGAAPTVRPALRLFKSSVVRLAWFDASMNSIRFRSFCAASAEPTP